MNIHSCVHTKQFEAHSTILLDARIFVRAGEYIRNVIEGGHSRLFNFYLSNTPIFRNFSMVSLKLEDRELHVPVTVRKNIWF